MSARPRILLIHTGGTLGMDPAKARPVGLHAGSYLRDLSAAVPELEQLARLEVRIPFNRDSAEVGPRHWARLARAIARNRADFAGFVIVHGTDTMAFSASALSFCLAGLGKPIVLTGSQRPLREIRTDARQNLINAVTCAADPRLHEVAISFGPSLLRGNRSRKLSTGRFDGFQSPNHPALATMGLFIDWNLDALLPAPTEPAKRFRFAFAPEVARIPVVPGVAPELFARLPVRAVLLEGFGTGNVPSEAGWVERIAAWRKAGVLVALGSQCVDGPVDPSLYRSGQRALDAGAFSIGDMTPEAALCKLMFCLGNGLPFDAPLAGEVG